MAKCDTGQSLRDKLNQNSELDMVENRRKIEEKIVLPKESRVFKLLKKIGDHNIFHREITQEEWDKLYGAQDIRQNMADKIALILKSNKHLAEYMIEYIVDDSLRLEYKLPKDTFIRDSVTGEVKPVLEKMPIASLNKYYNELSQWSKATGEVFNRAYTNKLRISFELPKRLQMKENSGAFAKIFRATQRHSDRVAARIKKFGKDIDNLIGEVDEIWLNIEPTVKDAWRNQHGLSEQDAKDWFVSVFHRMIHGQILQVDTATYEKSMDKKGNKIYKDGPGLYINTQWAPTGKKYDTGDEVYAWQVPRKFDSNIEGKLVDFRGNERRDLLNFIQMAPNLSDTIVGELVDKANKYRKIDNDAFNHITKNLTDEFKLLVSELKNHFPKLNVKEVEQLFVEEDLSVLDRLDVDTANSYADNYRYLQDNFVQYSLSEPFLLEGLTFQYRENHFPALYHTTEFALMIKESIATIKSELEVIKKAKGDTLDQRREIKTKRIALNSSLLSHESLLRDMLDMPTDLSSNTKMTTRRQSKYMKHITNSFDLLKMRTDRNVSYDSLKHSMTAIERNVLTRELLESLRMTDDVNVKDALVSLYKGTIGYPDARANIFGLEHSNEDLPESVQMIAKSVRDFWMFKLWSPSTAFINQFGNIQKIIEMGTNETFTVIREHKKWMENDAIRPKLKSLIEDGGVTQFEDFFTHTIVKDMEEVQIKRESALRMSAAFLQYYDNIGSKRMNVKAARKLLSDILMEELGKSIRWDAILSADEAKALRSVERKRKLKAITGKFVNFAISKEYVMSKALRDESYGSIRNLITGKSVMKLTSSTLEKVAELTKGLMPSFTMSETEKTLRTTSFIMGVKAAQARGLLPPMPMWELTGQDRNDAIKHGRMMTRMIMDFGMSKNDVGEMHRSVLGGLLGQFAVWKQQKMDADINLYKSAWKQVKGDNSIPKAIRDIVPLLFRFRKYPQEALRTSHKDVAALRAFLATQGVLTLAFDLFLGMNAFFNNPALRALGYHVGFSKMGGATSDVQAWINLSVMLMLNMFTQSWWEDDEDIERTISYYMRRTPLGLGAAFIYDMASLIAFWNDDKIREKKLSNSVNYALPGVPMPVVKAVGKAVIPED